MRKTSKDTQKILVRVSRIIIPTLTWLDWQNRIPAKSHRCQELRKKAFDAQSTLMILICIYLGNVLQTAMENSFTILYFIRAMFWSWCNLGMSLKDLEKIIQSVEKDKMCLFRGFLKGETNYILVGSSRQISLLIKRLGGCFLIFKKRICYKNTL